MERWRSLVSFLWNTRPLAFSGETLPFSDRQSLSLAASTGSGKSCGRVLEKDDCLGARCKSFGRVLGKDEFPDRQSLMSGASIAGGMSCGRVLENDEFLERQSVYSGASVARGRSYGRAPEKSEFADKQGLSGASGSRDKSCDSVPEKDVSEKDEFSDKQSFYLRASITRGKNGGRVLDRYEKLWQDLLANPSQWWDNRAGKPNPRFPDFKHKETGKGLWVIDGRNPPWVGSELGCIAPGLSILSGPQRLSRYNKAGQYEKTVELFEQMGQGGVKMDGYFYIHVFNACAALQSLQKGKLHHEQLMETGCELDLHVSSSLVDMYAKCGAIDEAWRVFKKMPRRNVVVWSAMIQGCVRCGQGQKALELFQQMHREGIMPNSVTFVGVLNACASMGALEGGRLAHQQVIQSGCESDAFVGSSLVDMYAKCGSIDDAWSVFDKMPARQVVGWNAMILGFVKCGQGLKALELFRQMQGEGIQPDCGTFVAVLNACASLAALETGKAIHKQIIETGSEFDLYVSSSLVDMFAKCGSLGDAERLFDKMSTRNVAAWNAMIMAYAIHGNAKEAVALFEQMVLAGSQLNKVTFVCLLSACSHGGLVKEGLQYFDSMRSVYNVSPTLEHYSCMVDLLCRAGCLSDAEEMLNTMPFEPSASAWKSLLGACRIHGNMEMGERAFKQVLKLEPEDFSGYVLLSNMYAAAGQWDSKAMVQEQRENKETTWRHMDGII